MSDRTAVRLARALFVLTTLCLVGGGVAALALAARGLQSWRAILPDIFFAAVQYSFSVVGMIIARRQPRNAVAWVLLGVGLSWTSELPIGAYITWATHEPGYFDRAAVVGAVNSALWVTGIAPLGTFLLLLFPDGHLPSVRWRWCARLTGVVSVVSVLGVVGAPGPIEGYTPETINPLGYTFLEGRAYLIYVPILMIPVLMVCSAVALVRRYRRSVGVERLQLKWLTATAALVAAMYLVTMIVSAPYDWVGNAPTWVGVLQNASLFTFMLIPIAVGVAITRYRLYDIDRLINRALVYGLVSAALVVVYVLGVVGVGGALRSITGQEQSNLAVAGSTLAVAALFRPFRGTAQRFIDARFYRARYDAARTVEAFSSRLRQETDAELLAEALRGVVAQTVQPDKVSIWIATR